MKFFSKVMIGLDLTEMDEILIEKTVVFLKFWGVEKCYFVHVAKSLAIPDEILREYPDLLAAGDESVEAIMMNKIKSKAFPDSIEIEVFAEEGDHPLDTVLRWAKIKDVDLIVMGRKETLKGTGALANGVAKKAPCSVMLLQEKRPAGLPKKIMVPTDFSEHNHMIYKFGERIADQLKAQLVPVHIYQVPHGYSKTGKSYEEFAEIMKANAKKDFEAFVAQHDHPELECDFVLDEGEDVGELLLKEAMKLGVDMFIMGSRGRTKSAAILLGSTAEKVIKANNVLPMLIFKKKGETMGFFDALFRL
ncbi:universal stress protein [Algoriphagus zhangzhouensis]|uniref:Nucleotide-binding universal stress protein, UspA family n=1 Tax=Algoriphagus zhangzhouensis TaxID=1073327 RepID=A0A1M7ZBH2_9BACT|nr:universal stress protein [Algoriphagus zhangzhouensis]TDY46780.1 nucleotide-binding universal stress UspA family protein [Algoriphagus zhangzhouensis]SHO62261.1 Nucleotide-binding universal stress protein, UspA family [Algoriphagus zhangzhouensis]